MNPSDVNKVSVSKTKLRCYTYRLQQKIISQGVLWKLIIVVVILLVIQWMQIMPINLNKKVSMQHHFKDSENKFQFKDHSKNIQNLSKIKIHVLGNVMQAVNQVETTDDFKEFLNVPAERLQDNMLHLHNFKYIINERNICKNQTFFVLTVIHSSVQNFKMRNNIRKTLKTFPNSEQERLVTIFLIAKTTNISLQANIEKESYEHSDIIQGSFLDHYKNLTYKNVMGLHWIVNFCNQTKYVLKTDDDVLINPFHLITFLHNAQASRKNINFLYCSVYSHHHPIRLKGDKWYTSERDYPQRTYPPYCEGFAYIMSVDVVRKFFAVTPKAPFYWVDDVYVTGFLAYLSGVKHTTMSSIHSYTRMSDKYSNRSIQQTLFYLSKSEQDRKHWFTTWKQIKDYWLFDKSVKGNLTKPQRKA